MKGTAVGTLKVISHAAAVGADGTEFPAWVEVRVVLDPQRVSGERALARRAIQSRG
jgi:hypothetical protein